MTTLYRTPNLILGAHEWHATVLLNGGHVSLVYRWRPLSLKRVAWSTLRDWQGPKPKDLCDRFWMFRNHIRQATDSERVRQEAIAALRGPPSAATVANTDERRGKRALAILATA